MRKLYVDRQSELSQARLGRVIDRRSELSQARLGRVIKYLLTMLAVGAVITASVFAPSLLSGLSDAGILNTVHINANESLAEGYRYQLTSNEKLFILSKALAAREEIISNYAASVRGRIPTGRESIKPSYAYTVNENGPAENEMSRQEALAFFYEELAELNTLGIAPPCDFEFNDDDYEMELYSAVDMLEPERMVSVWQITYTGRLPNIGDALMEAYLDAETGKIYSFAMRSARAENMYYNEGTRSDFPAEDIIAAWCEYLQLGSPEPAAEYNGKYSVAGAGEERTIITAGFHEGINEIFLRIF